jgi:hypothetical protein
MPPSRCEGHILANEQNYGVQAKLARDISAFAIVGFSR